MFFDLIGLVLFFLLKSQKSMDKEGVYEKTTKNLVPQIM